MTRQMIRPGVAALKTWLKVTAGGAGGGAYGPGPNHCGVPGAGN